MLALGYPETIDQSAETPRLVAVSGPVSQPDTPTVVGSDLLRHPSLILHQAPLNHGNSGGPLLNSARELVGINTVTGAGAGSGQIQGQYYCEIAQANAGKTIEVYGVELYGENAGKYFNVEVLLP